jgi:opacity protein-like surface antigen
MVSVVLRVQKEAQKMKKITALIILLFTITSSSFAAQAGKWQFSINNLITGNYMNDFMARNQSLSGSLPCIGYNFTEEQAVDFGYISHGLGSQTVTAGLIKYSYYFGHGNLQPHIGLSFGQFTTETRDVVWESSALSLLFGTQVNILEGLSIEFDFRPLSSVSHRTIRTDDPADKEDDYLNATFVNFQPIFNLRWVF